MQRESPRSSLLPRLWLVIILCFYDHSGVNRHPTSWQTHVQQTQLMFSALFVAYWALIALFNKKHGQHQAEGLLLLTALQVTPHSNLHKAGFPLASYWGSQCRHRTQCAKLALKKIKAKYFYGPKGPAKVLRCLWAFLTFSFSFVKPHILNFFAKIYFDYFRKGNVSISSVNTWCQPCLSNVAIFLLPKIQRRAQTLLYYGTVRAARCYCSVIQSCRYNSISSLLSPPQLFPCHVRSYKTQNRVTQGSFL